MDHGLFLDSARSVCYAERMLTVYVATENSDLTEGKGMMVPIGYFLNVDDAVAAVQGRGVMGTGHGEVFAATIFDSFDEWAASEKPRPYPRKKIWGYRKDWKGAWNYGWVDNRDAPINDPDYETYIKLKRKFGDS